jgi:uncharacterized protein YqgV (UPF0045/DUF77 family)
MGSHELIGVTVALYPLQSDPDRTVHRFIDALDATEVSVEVGPMTTLVTGAADDVFRALRRAYDEVAPTGPVVMTVTVSNACPVPATDAQTDPPARR